MIAKTNVVIFTARGVAANDRQGAADMRAEFSARWEAHAQACRQSWTPERKTRAAAASRAAWVRRTAAANA
jgi:hypothetical protein